MGTEFSWPCASREDQEKKLREAARNEHNDDLLPDTLSYDPIEGDKSLQQYYQQPKVQNNFYQYKVNPPLLNRHGSSQRAISPATSYGYGRSFDESDIEGEDAVFQILSEEIIDFTELVQRTLKKSAYVRDDTM